MNEQLQALQDNRTWDLVPCFSQHSLVMGLYKKLKSNESLKRYKASLVALGYQQEYDINLDRTFAPIVKLTPESTILTLVTKS